MNSTEYQAGRQKLLEQIDRLRTVRDELTARDPDFVKNLPLDVRQKMLLLDRDGARLRNADLTIAFVGGFNAGKSSLVNAFLGRYLLPESAKVTTAVPTYVRLADGVEGAELHYLNIAEVEELDQLYRTEIAKLFGQSSLATLPSAQLLEQVEPLVREGRGRALVQQFRLFDKTRHQRSVAARHHMVMVGLAEAQEKIRDETEAMFMDRVVLRVRDLEIPPDVVLVDLPGVSVPNPRHRAITFRFVREEAHAVVFVLMAPQPFNKDDVEIMELFRAGENRIAEKTFWVLNRWDSLSVPQQQQTIREFEEKMRDLAVPDDCQSFRTNALHGLLSQMSIEGGSPADLALQSHLKEYQGKLETHYGGSHHTAFRDSQIPFLQKQVLGFLNARLRETTLRSAIDSARSNFCEPLAHYLTQTKLADDAAISGPLTFEEKQVRETRLDHRFNDRMAEIKRQLQNLRNDVAVKRTGILREKNEELVKRLRGKIDNGPETDAYQIYQEIIAERELRKYPYHFEIEMRIVDNLNTMFKRNFRQIVREQVEVVVDELTENVRTALVKVREDVAYNAEALAPFEDVLLQGRESLVLRVDGFVMSLAAQLDELLLFKPKTWYVMGGNEILQGLESAARMGFDSLKNPGQAIRECDFAGKTRQIRTTLTENYIDKIRQFHEQITQDIFPVVINNIQEIERKISEIMQTKYRPVLESAVRAEVGNEYAGKRKSLEENARRFRGLIEQIQHAMMEMDQLLDASESLAA